MIFSLIMILIGVLCILLFATYIIQGISTKRRIKNLRKETLMQESIEKEETKEVLYTNQNTEIEDIASAISDALKEEKPINLTNFEEDQERTAIISIDELMKKAKELELLEDEQTGVNYLEKYNLEPAEVEAIVDTTMNNEKVKEVKAFKVSQVISPIYGVKKEAIDNNG